MWKTHTPTVLVDAGIALSKRALPDRYRQFSPSSCSHLYPLSLMISVCSSSPHLSLAIPAYASLSVGWLPTHQVPCMRFHDCDFDNSRVCAADVAISNAATLVRSKLCPLRMKSRTPAASWRMSIRKPSCLISCSQRAPAGGLAAGLGRQGSQKSGKITRRNNMGYKYQRARTSRVGLVHENQDAFRLPRGYLGHRRQHCRTHRWR
jgi:hypothetical protein